MSTDDQETGPGDRTYSTREVAALARRDPRTVLNWAKAELAEASWVVDGRGTRRYDADKVDAFLRSRVVTGIRGGADEAAAWQGLALEGERDNEALRDEVRKLRDELARRDARMVSLRKAIEGALELAFDARELDASSETEHE